MKRYSPLRSERLALALLLLLVLAGLKMSFSPGLGHRSLDGNYYFQVARHVAEGEGLQTSISLYHQGLSELPHATNVAPLWPLTLGTTGRLLGLEQAARLVPSALYLVALALLFVLAQAVEREWRPGGDEPRLLGSGVLGLGPMAVLLFGLNPIFFRFTSLPYTEALAFVLLFAALLAAARAMREGALWWAALAGALAMATFMTRVQFVGAPIWVCATLALWAGRDPGRWKIPGAAAGTALVLLAPWVLFLRGWVDPFSLKVLLGVGNYRETLEVAPYQMQVATGSTVEFLLDRLAGLRTAFDPSDENSYLRSFGGAALLVPLALLWSLGRLGNLRPSRWRPLVESWPVTTMAVGAGALMLAPLHIWHYRYFKEWLFGFRHGLPLILLIVPAIALLASRTERSWRWVVGALVLASVLSGALGVGIVLGTDYRPGLAGAEQELVLWLDRQPSPSGGSGPAVAVTTQAQTLTAFSRSGFHWIQCDEDSAQTRALLEHTSAGLVVAYPGESRCPFLTGLVSDLEVIEIFGEPPLVLQVMRLREGS